MNFIRQIKLEFVNILRSKFLMIIGIVTISLGMIIPVISYLASLPANNNNNGYQTVYNGVAVEYAYSTGVEKGVSPDDYVGESITVNGVTIYESNPVFWEIKARMDEIEIFEAGGENFVQPGTLALYSELTQLEIDQYVEFAKVVSTYEDYRYQLIYAFTTNLQKQYFLSYKGNDTAALEELAETKLFLSKEEFDKQYVNIPASERSKLLEDLDLYFADLKETLESNSFEAFVKLMVASQNTQIEELQKQIEIQEELIAKSPSLEESTGEYIAQLKDEIKNIEENIIPLWEYRLEKNIIPGTNSWQNVALMDIENYNNQLLWDRIVSEKDFKTQQWLIEQYKTYDKYVKAMEKVRNKYQNEIVIAKKSLDSDLPDMKYVPGGARSETTSFLFYAVIAALYAILLGGWLIASEFQSGTIRLLLIRPKTRVKILLSKYLAGLSIAVIVYMLGILVNILCNGIFKGFTDFAYPNFTVTSQINFFADYLPKMLVCIVTIFMGYSIAFMLSSVIRNTAVAAVLPIVGYVGCMLSVQVLAFTTNPQYWFAFTPLPYVNLSAFLTNSYEITHLIDRGVGLSLPIGLIMLSVIGVVSVVIATIVFKKRDVAN